MHNRKIFVKIEEKNCANDPLIAVKELKFVY